MAVSLRFECGREDRIGRLHGPFEFVQLTYNSLRVGPDGHFFASYHEGDWGFDDEAPRHGVKPEEMGEKWSDIVIFQAD
jgi:hypothetical protein